MIGPSTRHFFLLDKYASLATRIFLDSESVQSAISLSKKLDATSVSPRNLMFQVRQLQSKYHLPSTYFLCRAAGPIIQAHTYHPYTVFTIADFDQGRTPQAKLFSVLAENVLKKGNDAILDKALVNNIYLKATGTAETILGSILNLFVAPATRLTILGNDSLNILLEQLAQTWCSPISNANRSSQAAVILSRALSELVTGVFPPPHI